MTSPDATYDSNLLLNNELQKSWFCMEKFNSKDESEAANKISAEA